MMKTLYLILFLLSLATLTAAGRKYCKFKKPTTTVDVISTTIAGYDTEPSTTAVTSLPTSTSSPPLSYVLFTENTKGCQMEKYRNSYICNQATPECSCYADRFVDFGGGIPQPQGLDGYVDDTIQQITGAWNEPCAVHCREDTVSDGTEVATKAECITRCTVDELRSLGEEKAQNPDYTENCQDAVLTVSDELTFHGKMIVILPAIYLTCKEQLTAKIQQYYNEGGRGTSRYASL